MLNIQANVFAKRYVFVENVFFLFISPYNNITDFAIVSIRFHE